MLGWIYRICMDINECEAECQDVYKYRICMDINECEKECQDGYIKSVWI